MSKTVVVISETGRLINVTGADKESDAHYLYFAKRLLGDNGTYATLDYGWNGSRKLKISGANGQEILLEAAEVKISGDLVVNGTPIQDIIDASIYSQLDDIVQGTTGEIDVLESDYSGSEEGHPRKTYTVSISEDFKSRIRSLENQIAGMFSFDEVYYAGDGLVTIDDPVRNTINVFIGTGLKWESKEYDFDISGSSSSPEVEVLTKPAIAVDCESSPVPLSIKPITAGAVFNAIRSATAQKYVLGVDSGTGNVVLYDNVESSQSSSEE